MFFWKSAKGNSEGRTRPGRVNPFSRGTFSRVRRVKLGEFLRGILKKREVLDLEGGDERKLVVL